MAASQMPGVFPNLPGLTINPVPTYYFNGFPLSLTPADITLMIAVDGAPQAKLAMSFTTAKTMSVYLKDLIDQLERVTNHDIMTTEQVQAGLSAAEAESGRKST